MCVLKHVFISVRIYVRMNVYIFIYVIYANRSLSNKSTHTHHTLHTTHTHPTTLPVNCRSKQTVQALEGG